MTLHLAQIIAIPLIGGLIGWLTNMVAVRMLFRPRRPFHLLGLRFQGLVPRRQPEIAASIGHTVEKHLIGTADIRRVLERPEVHEGVEAALRERMGVFIDKRLVEIHPMIGMFLNGPIRLKLEGMLMEEVEQMLPVLAERMIVSVENQLDFQQIVEQKIREFDLARLEEMILSIARRELKAIELLGGVLGLLIGCVQVALLAI